MRGGCWPGSAVTVGRRPGTALSLTSSPRRRGRLSAARRTIGAAGAAPRPQADSAMVGSGARKAFAGCAVCDGRRCGCRTCTARLHTSDTVGRVLHGMPRSQVGRSVAPLVSRTRSVGHLRGWFGLGYHALEATREIRPFCTPVQDGIGYSLCVFLWCTHGGAVELHGRRAVREPLNCTKKRAVRALSTCTDSVQFGHRRHARIPCSVRPAVVHGNRAEWPQSRVALEAHLGRQQHRPAVLGQLPIGELSPAGGHDIGPPGC
jgi:hypothetical protein